MDIGANVRQLRRRAGLTQRDLAREVGVTQGAISMIESGVTRRLSVNMAAQLAAVFGVSLDALVQGEGRGDVAAERN